MKKTLRILIACLPFCFFGCASSKLYIPGEKEIVYKNLAIENLEIADAYLDLKNYAKAAEFYKKAMRNKSIYMTAFYKYARCLALARDWDNSLDAYNRLIELDPENLSLKLSIAYITAMSGKIDESIIMYKELVGSHPDDEGVLENYISLLLNVGRAEDAEKQYFILKEKFPDNSKIKSFEQTLKTDLDNFSVPEK